MSATERVLIGTLGRPHGLKGEVTVALHTDEPQRRFAVGAAVEVGPGGKPMKVAGTRRNGAVWLVALEGVADRTAAEALRGHDVWARVPADEAPAADGEYYDRQLVGLEVRSAVGERAGTIKSVLHHSAQDLLVVDCSGEERLIPFVVALVPVVDLDGGFVQVADVPGLLSDEDD